MTLLIKLRENNLKNKTKTKTAQGDIAKDFLAKDSNYVTLEDSEDKYLKLESDIIHLYQTKDFEYRVKLLGSRDYVACVGTMEYDDDDINTVSVMRDNKGNPYLEMFELLNRKTRRAMNTKTRCIRKRGKRKVYRQKED